MQILKRPTGLPLINMQNVTTKLYHLLTPKLIWKSCQGFTILKVYRNVFPKLHFFTGLLFAKANLTKSVTLPKQTKLLRRYCHCRKAAHQSSRSNGKRSTRRSLRLGSASGSQQKTLVWEVVVLQTSFFY